MEFQETNGIQTGAGVKLVIYGQEGVGKTSLAAQLPGAVFAAAAWMIFSGIFSVYVDKYNNYSSFYGTMTTIALIMVWLYGCMYVLFIGGIINRTWEERMEAKKYYK